MKERRRIFEWKKKGGDSNEIKEKIRMKEKRRRFEWKKEGEDFNKRNKFWKKKDI